MSLKTALFALVAVVCLIEPVAAGSNSPTIPVQTRAALGALSDADSQSPQYQHVYVPEKGYAALYDYDTTSTASCPSAGYVAPDSSYICTTPVVSAGRWVRQSVFATSAVPTIAQLAAYPSSWFAANKYVHVVEHHTGYVQGGGDFVYQTAAQLGSVTPDNLGLIISPSDYPSSCAAGCYVRVLPDGALYGTMFGSPLNGIDDDYPTLTSMITAGFNYGLRPQGTYPGFATSITDYRLCDSGRSITLNSPLVIEARNTTPTGRSNQLSLNIYTGGCPVFVGGSGTGKGAFDLKPTGFDGGTGTYSDLKSINLYGQNSIVYMGAAEFGVLAESNYGATVQDFRFEGDGASSQVAVINRIVGLAAENRYSERNRFINLHARKVAGCYANQEPVGADISFDDTEVNWFKCDITLGPDSANTIAFNLHGYQGRSIYSGLTVWKRSDASSAQKAFYLDGNFETVTGISWAVDGGSGKLHDIEFGSSYGCQSADCDTNANLTLTVTPQWVDGQGKLALPTGWESKINVMVKQTNFGKLVNQNGYNEPFSPLGRTRISSDAGYMDHTAQLYFASGSAGTVQTSSLTLYGTQKIYSSDCSVYVGSTDTNVIADIGSSKCGIATLTANGDDTITALLYRVIGPQGRDAHVFFHFITDRN